ncbi:MAG TPA: glycosyltransferase family A protein [Steroidobacteraceae bacterium]|nr:glycosyltransferase family A protein [Steroidobacteraceae bacterium]
MTEILSAVVCTRNRPAPMAETVRLLLDGSPADMELIVIDQSDDQLTEQALQPFHADPRLRYRRTKTRGKGAALNEALAVARGSILVCTDDDCLAPHGWVRDMTVALQSRPDCVIAYCKVAPVPHDYTKGYVPCYLITGSRTLHSVGDICGGIGIGAGMSVRRSFVIDVGGFDDSFGPGGRFPSADEWDLSIRALLKGHSVFETGDISIVHDGFRNLHEGRAHVRRDWVALGAVCAKPLRAGYWKSLRVSVWLFSVRAVWPIVTDMVSLRRPRGFARITSFLNGFARGFATPVDPVTLRFRRRGP